MPNNIPTGLIDTSFLVALRFQKDERHHLAIQSLKRFNENFSISTPVLIEFLFIARRIYGYERAVREMQAILSIEVSILEPIPEDYRRAVQIMQQYIDAKIDLADAIQVALAERLQITRICTFDRRDFSLFRPIHCEYFELIP